MPTIKERTTLAANGTAFPLTGNQYEYLPRRAKVQFAVLVEEVPAGAAAEATIYTGSNVVMQGSTVDTRAAAEPIQRPYDVVAEDIVAGGERISVQLRETGGVASVVRTVVWIQWF